MDRPSRTLTLSAKAREAAAVATEAHKTPNEVLYPAGAAHAARIATKKRSKPSKRPSARPGPRARACPWCANSRAAGSTPCQCCHCPGFGGCTHLPGAMCVKVRYGRRLVCNPCERAKLAAKRARQSLEESSGKAAKPRKRARAYSVSGESSTTEEEEATANAVAIGRTREAWMYQALPLPPKRVAGALGSASALSPKARVAPARKRAALSKANSLDSFSSMLMHPTDFFEALPNDGTASGAAVGNTIRSMPASVMWFQQQQQQQHLLTQQQAAAPATLGTNTWLNLPTTHFSAPSAEGADAESAAQPCDVQRLEHLLGNIPNKAFAPSPTATSSGTGRGFHAPSHPIPRMNPHGAPNLHAMQTVRPLSWGTLPLPAFGSMMHVSDPIGYA